MQKRLYSFVGHILLVLLIYNYIFPIRFTFFSNFSDVVFLVSIVVFLLFILYRRTDKLLLNKEGFLLILSWIGLVIIASISIIINSSDDIGVIKVLMNYIFTFMYATCLIGCVKLGLFGDGFKFDGILKIIVLSCFVIAVSVLLEVFSLSFKSAVTNLLYKSGNIDYSESFRASGFSVAGGAALSFGLSFGCGISLIMALRSDTAMKYVSYYFFAFSIFAATIFVGRTGLILAALFIVASLRYFSLSKSLYFGIVILAAYIILFQLLSLLSDDVLRYYVYHSFELFNNYLEYGSFASRTSDEVLRMYFLPDTKHFILGAGFMNSPLHGYILPDPGYMKVLLSFGVFGFIVFYSLSTFIIYRTYSYFCKFDIRYKLLFLIVLTSFFVYEAKEPGLYQNYGFRILMLLFAFGVVTKTSLSNRHKHVRSVS